MKFKCTECEISCNLEIEIPDGSCKSKSLPKICPWGREEVEWNVVPTKSEPKRTCCYCEEADDEPMKKVHTEDGIFYAHYKCHEEICTNYFLERYLL